MQSTTRASIRVWEWPPSWRLFQQLQQENLLKRAKPKSSAPPDFFRICACSFAVRLGNLGKTFYQLRMFRRCLYTVWHWSATMGVTLIKHEQKPTVHSMLAESAWIHSTGLTALLLKRCVFRNLNQHWMYSQILILLKASLKVFLPQTIFGFFNFGPRPFSAWVTRCL